MPDTEVQLPFLHMCVALLVSELVGWVRNVILINVYLDLENPGGVMISGGRVQWAPLE